MEINKIYRGDCVEIMKAMSDSFVDLTVTSPPYDQLRDYKGYTFNFEDVAKELYRVTKGGGIVVWVVGDQVIDGSESGTSMEQALFFKKIGFRLHDTMIYAKTGMSKPSNNRYHQVWEYMFVLSKGAPKTVNLIKDKKNIWGGKYSFGKTTQRLKDGSLKTVKGKRMVAEYGIRFNIWRYSNGYGYSAEEDIAYSHPAIFPEELAEDHIVSWSNPGDLVLDPFVGSGTTCKMAKRNGRNFIGIDISEKYCEITRKRILNTQLKLMI